MNSASLSNPCSLRNNLAKGAGTTGGCKEMSAATFGSEAFSASRHTVGAMHISAAATASTPRYSCRDSAKVDSFAASVVLRPPLPGIEAPERRSNSNMRDSKRSTILRCKEDSGKHNTLANRVVRGLPKTSQVCSATIVFTLRCHSLCRPHRALRLDEEGGGVIAKAAGYGKPQGNTSSNLSGISHVEGSKQ
eukprot:3585052-Amphidinium_carterae.2